MTEHELELRIKRLEWVVVRMMMTDSRIYLGACVNGQCGPPRHPHWIPEPQIDWDQPIIYLP